MVATAGRLVVLLVNLALLRGALSSAVVDLSQDQLQPGSPIPLAPFDSLHDPRSRRLQNLSFKEQAPEAGIPTSPGRPRIIGSFPYPPSGTFNVRWLTVPGAQGGANLEDLTFSRRLRRVLAPAGRTSKLDLIDPETEQIQTIAGFPSSPLSGKGHSGPGHGEGAISADEGLGLIFAADGLAKQLVVIDPKNQVVIAKVPLANPPRYVRFVALTREVWITEPTALKIEILSIPASGPPIPRHEAFITTFGQTDLLLVDEVGGRAYVRGSEDTTFAIDLRSRSFVLRFANGCVGEGLALDSKRDLLFVGCPGRLNVLDLRHGGWVLDSQPVEYPVNHSPCNIERIAYDPVLTHLYVAFADGGMRVFHLSTEGKLKELLGTSACPGSHMVVDDRHRVWVVCPQSGDLLVFKDELRPAG